MCTERAITLASLVADNLTAGRFGTDTPPNEKPRASHPTIWVVGAGRTGDRLLELLRDKKMADNVTCVRHVSGQACVPDDFAGVDIVLMLARRGEADALHLTQAVANAARLAGVFVIGMVAQGGTGDRSAKESQEFARSNLNTLVQLPSVQNDLATPTRLSAYVASTVDGLAYGFRRTAPVSADILDARTVFAHKGNARIGIGCAEGEERSRRAVVAAMEDIGESRIHRAKGVLIMVAGSRSLRLRELATVANLVHAHVAAECDTCLAAHYDDELGAALRVTLIAAGFWD
jgi:cell division protein FtsZ